MIYVQNTLRGEKWAMWTRDDTFHSFQTSIPLSGIEIDTKV